MQQPHDPYCAHPAGERLFPSLKTTPAWPVDTPGGRYYAEFDDQAPVTREGQLIFFAQFLHSGGRWARLLRGDTLNPPLLGMTRTVSEDVMRRAMKRIDERTGFACLETRACAGSSAPPAFGPRSALKPRLVRHSPASPMQPASRSARSRPGLRENAGRVPSPKPRRSWAHESSPQVKCSRA